MTKLLDDDDDTSSVAADDDRVHGEEVNEVEHDVGFAAVAQAKEQGKDLLVDFTGSDWCAWCIRLDEEVGSDLLDVLQMPPSDNPRMDEHPEEVWPSTKLALERLEQNGVSEVVESAFAKENLSYLSARWERRWVWAASTQSWTVKSRCVAREFKTMDPYRDDCFVPGAPLHGPID